MRRALIPYAIPLAVCATITLVAPRARAQAQDPDPWFAKDKALHFGASAIIAGGGYGVAATQLDARYQRLLVGGGLGIAAGAGKELLDMTGFGDPSWKDFAWDVIGTVFGLAVAWGIDLLVRGTGASHPLFGDPPREPAR